MKLNRIEKAKLWISMIPSRFRVALGFCPLCNSDAPELYDCPLCKGYHSARGDDFPPSNKLKTEWLEEMRGVKMTQINIKRIIRNHQKTKTQSEAEL